MIIFLLTSPKDENEEYKAWTNILNVTGKDDILFDVENGDAICFVNSKSWIYEDREGQYRIDLNIGEKIKNYVGKQKEALIAFHHPKLNRDAHNEFINKLETQIGNLEAVPIGYLYYSIGRETPFPKDLPRLKEVIIALTKDDRKDETSKSKDVKDIYKELHNIFLTAYKIDRWRLLKARIEDSILCKKTVELMEEAINVGKTTLEGLHKQLQKESDDDEMARIKENLKEALNTYIEVKKFFDGDEFKTIKQKLQDISRRLEKVDNALHRKISAAERSLNS